MFISSIIVTEVLLMVTVLIAMCHYWIQRFCTMLESMIPAPSVYLYSLVFTKLCTLQNKTAVNENTDFTSTIDYIMHINNCQFEGSQNVHQ